MRSGIFGSLSMENTARILFHVLRLEMSPSED